MEEGRSAFKILIGEPTGKRPLGNGSNDFIFWPKILPHRGIEPAYPVYDFKSACLVPREHGVGTTFKFSQKCTLDTLG